MNTYYCQFSIGPVQPFIAASRKTIDLIGGSRLLSDLAKTALDTFTGNGVKTEVFFPYQTAVEDASGPSYPNRFFAAIHDTTREAAARLLANCEKAVKADFKERAQRAMDELQPDRIPWDPLWEKQIDHFLRIDWVFCGNRDTYREVYRYLGVLMGSRKSLAAFTQWEEPGRERCLLSPDYSVAAPEGVNDRSAIRAHWTKIAEHRFPYISFKERLSAISIVKRYAGQKRNVPSILEIANAHLIHNIKESPELQQCWERVRNTVAAAISNKVNADEILRSLEWELLYPETLRALSRTDNEFQITLSRETIKEIRTGLKRLKTACQPHAVFWPRRYYGIMYFDGDRMGKHLSRVAEPNGHKEISRKLQEFNRAVGEVVQLYHGYLVYSGGDDVVAFASLEHILAMAEDIRELFSAILGTDFQGSAGIALVHIRHNLKHAMREARAAEGDAKEAVGRNGYAVYQVKRSGEKSRYGQRWEVDGLKTIGFTRQIMKYIQSGELTHGFIHAFMDVQREMVEPGILVHEYRRLLEHHLPREFDSDQKRDLIGKGEILLKHQYTGQQSNGTVLNALGSLLGLAEFLVRGEQ